MGFLAFLVAVAALAIAILAYQRAGGSKAELEKHLESLKEKTADTLAKAEKSLRGEEKPEE